MNNIIITIKKELRSIVRDKKTFITLLAMPLIGMFFVIVYGVMFDPDLKKEIIKEDLYTIDDFSKRVNDTGVKVDLIGEISKKYQDKFEKGRILPMNFNFTIGQELTKLALEKKDEDHDLFALVPNYLRESQAERDLEKK